MDDPLEPEPEPELDAQSKPRPTPEHHRVYAAAQAHYRTVAASGRLGLLPPDPPTTNASVLRTLPRTVPFAALALQLAWSFLLIGIVRWLPEKPALLSEAPQIELPNSVALAAGFSLFILLSFAVAEGTARRRAAINALFAVFHTLRHLTRKLRTMYPPGTWHDADLARLNAHLAAYPIALAQTLSATRDRDSLAPLLAAPDLARVSASPHDPHIAVGVVLRAYFVASEDDSNRNFAAAAAERTPSGGATRAAMHSLIDFVETNAATAHTIKQSRVAPPYVAVLRAASFIWALLVPVALVVEAGWWTPLWAFMATMPVFALLRVALALAAPFDQGLLAAPLAQLCTTAAADVLQDAAAPNLALSDVLRPADTAVPAWLTGRPIQQVRGYAPLSDSRDLRSAMSRAVRHALAGPVVLGMVTVMAWTGFIVLLTWGLSRAYPPFRRDGDRWWRVIIPVPDTAVTFIALALFLLLSFWLGDGNARRAAALDIWMARVRPNLDAAAHLVVQVLPKDVWHEGDRERLLAFITALPFCMVQHLRGSRDSAALYSLLSPADVQGFEDDPRPYPTHCADVIFAYLDAADAAEVSSEARDLGPAEPKHAFFATAFTFQARILEADRALWESIAIQKTPVAPQFTTHLTIFAGIWLALLPVTIVQSDGFLTFLYMAPIAFSMFTIIQISTALSDPFGSDEEDVPLGQVCDDIRDSIQRIYFAGRKGTRSVIHTDEVYRRELFDPTPAHAFMSKMAEAPPERDGKHTPVLHRFRSAFSSAVRNYRRLFNMSKGSPLRTGEVLPTTAEERIFEPTFVGTLLGVIARFPAISFRSYFGATLWSLIAVYASWGFGKLWEGQDRGECAQWCSPIDVQGNVLGNVGFALFMILALRVTNAVARYDSGAMMMFDLQRELRGLALEFLQTFKDGFFHSCDKERIIAHIVQIPLCLRDMLLRGDHGRSSAIEGLLTDGDKQRFEASASPFEHLIESIEVYLLMQDSTIREGWDLDPFRAGPGFSLPMLGRLLALRQIASRASVTKRFPLALSLLKIESMFTFIYIFLLPLTMTSETGFFTILWAPLISYGVLAVRDIAAALVDPFGNDPDDLPVRKMTADAVSGVLEAVASAGWDNSQLVKAPPPETAQNALCALGARLEGRNVQAKFALPSVEQERKDVGTSAPGFDAIEQRRAKQTLFTHIVYSAPWRAMVASFFWAVAASASTAALRRGALNNEWWNSASVITADVLDGVSFGAFTLLSFFATASAARYQRAGTLWQQEMRQACHALASNITKFYTQGAIHEGDHKRMLGLIAAIPLLIKQELRDSRDLRDVSALMTTADLAQSARLDSMTYHCIDVLRAYMLRISTRPDTLIVQDVASPVRARAAFVRFPILDIENAYAEMKFLNTFAFSPAFKTLLKLLLTIWFGVLPFLLFEVAGWLTLFWTPVIAYAILGLYAIANELSEPFGSDLNDHDVDAYSREIVEDILDIQQTQEPAFAELHDPQPAPEDWARELELPESDLDAMVLEKPRTRWWTRPLETARYAAVSVPLWQLALLAAWAGAVLGLAFGVREKFDPNCSGSIFCGLIAVNDDIKEYVGFALFFLLGARITESHARFTSALILFKGTVLRATRLVANRALQTFSPGAFHPGGDFARLAGHLAATAIALGASVRHNSSKEDLVTRLGAVVSERDAAAIAAARDPVGRCVDVVRAYVLQTEQLRATKPELNGIPNEEYFVVLDTLDQLHKGAAACEAIARVLQPFGLVMHSRLLLGAWLFILPVGIVTRTGWLVVLWTLVVGYGVLGVRRWAEELSMPFSCDEEALPVNAFVDEVVSSVRHYMRMFPRGASSLLEDGAARAGFEMFREAEPEARQGEADETVRKSLTAGNAA